MKSLKGSSALTSFWMILTGACSICLLADSSAQEATGKPLVIREAATHNGLVKTLKKARLEDPVKVFKPAESADPKVEGVKKDLLDQSDIICFNGAATLVPKRAIIYLPERLKSRLEWKKGSKLMTWQKFFASNMSWISTVEVNFDQAKGEQEFDDLQKRRLTNSPKLVIATYQKGPISVLPLKEEEPPTQ